MKRILSRSDEEIKSAEKNAVKEFLAGAAPKSTCAKKYHLSGERMNQLLSENKIPHTVRKYNSRVRRRRGPVSGTLGKARSVNALMQTILELDGVDKDTKLALAQLVVRL